MSQLIECVPNVSEGRRVEVIEALWDALAVPGVVRLDRSSDACHNRTVFTLVGSAKALTEAILRLYESALHHIDMSSHQGEHPRMGAVDVVPFVPIREATLEGCVDLAKSVGSLVASRFEIPVFLYAEAAAVPDRKVLANIRRGEFEGLAEKLGQPQWRPDFGPAAPHPRVGATAIGARPFLVAYNLQLNTGDIAVAKAIAKAVRASSGGLQNVQAMGVLLADRQVAQVSMNLLNFEKTPLYRVQEAVKAEARRFGVTVTDSEIVGLIPQAALDDAAAAYLQVGNWSKSLVLEERIRQEQEASDRFADQQLADFVASLQSAQPVPGGGCVASLVAALGASLVGMVGQLTRRPAYEAVAEKSAGWIEQGATLSAELLAAIDTDARAFSKVMAAFALPKATEADKAIRKIAIQAATKHAAEAPLVVATKAIEVTELAYQALLHGNPNAASDAGVAGLSALAALEGALLNVAINLGSLSDLEWVAGCRQKAAELLARAQDLRAALWRELNARIPEVATLHRVPLGSA